MKREAFPSRPCAGCKQLMFRRRWSNGRFEQKGDWLRRRYHDNACKGRAMLKHKTRRVKCLYCTEQLRRKKYPSGWEPLKEFQGRKFCDWTCRRAWLDSPGRRLQMVVAEVPCVVCETEPRRKGRVLCKSCARYSKRRRGMTGEIFGLVRAFGEVRRGQLLAWFGGSPSNSVDVAVLRLRRDGLVGLCGAGLYRPGRDEAFERPPRRVRGIPCVHGGFREACDWCDVVTRETARHKRVDELPVAA